MPSRLAVVLFTLVTSASGLARAEDTLPITVLVTGAPRAAEETRRGVERTVLPIELSFGRLPDARPRDPRSDAAVSALVASAREHYVSAEFDECIEAVSDDARIHALLGEGAGALAARVLFWRVACRVGAGDPEGALRDATRFATLDLVIPADVEAATPEVEAVLASAASAVEAARRVPLRVESEQPVSVSVDGRRPACITPCSVDLPEGDHVVTGEADGFERVVRLARVTGEGARLSLALEEASPERAAAQWRARVARSTTVDASASIALLARATRARRLVVLHALEEGRSARVRGALAVDGRVLARAERGPSDGEPEETASAVLRELLVEGDVIEPAKEVWESPWLFIGIGLAAAAAAALTAALLYERGTRTEVGF